MKDKCMKRIEELFEKYEKDVNLCLKVYEIIKTAEEEERPGLFKQVALLLKRSNFIEKEKMCGISDEEMKLEVVETEEEWAYVETEEEWAYVEAILEFIKKMLLKAVEEV